jgi:phosphoribosyl 1,2-cyclic phosphate phosphodiesterase
VERADGGGDITRFLIDTSPDLREQLLDAGVDRLDGVVFSHDHADQTHGIDDVRALVIRNRAAIPVYADEPTWQSLHRRFGYCFDGVAGYPPILAPRTELKPYQPAAISGPGGDIDLLPLRLEHGDIDALGFRVGNVAYCNDVKGIPEYTKAYLHDLDVLIIDALRYLPHPTHAHLELALSWIDELKPKRAILTNLHVDMDYRTLQRELPAHVEPGYDGMQVSW